MSTSRNKWFVMAILTSLGVGCAGSAGPSGPPPIPAKGKVTYKNQPVEGANVSFVGDGRSKPAYAITDASGEFILTTNRSGDGAVPGTHKVIVSKIIESPGAKKTSGPMSMEDAAKASQATPPAKPMHMVPEKYASADTSPLSYEVKQGDKNEFAIDLTD